MTGQRLNPKDTRDKRHSRAHNTRMVICFIAAALVQAGCAPKKPPQQKPLVAAKNLILISMDTVRADHLGCYGYDRGTTPQIDAYAERGTVFEHCTSSSSWTVPAHLTMLTGLEPATHGCVYYPKPPRLNAGYETLAKILTRAGFRTAAFTGGGYAGNIYGLDIGFEKFESLGLRFEYNIIPAKRWIEKHQAERFFLFLHGFNAHRPYIPPAPYDTKFSDGYSGDYNIRDFGPGKAQPKEADLKYVISQYDGEIGFVDEMLGDFIAWLEQRGLLANTLIILTSDHGDEFYEHGKCDHIHSIYDELTRVPWIMLGPSIPTQRIEQHVGTIDIVPTVLTLLGVSTTATLQGVDRTNLLFEQTGEVDAPVYMFTGMAGPPHHLAGVRTSRWLLVTNQPCGLPNPKCPDCSKGQHNNGPVELYNVIADPREQTNVAEMHPDVVRNLSNLLTERITQSTKLRMNPEAPPPATQEHLDALRSLGYVGDDDH